MNPNFLPGLASIVVPCFNQLECTRLCLRALVRHTRPAWELILVDNQPEKGSLLFHCGIWAIWGMSSETWAASNGAAPHEPPPQRLDL